MAEFDQMLTKLIAGDPAAQTRAEHEASAHAPSGIEQAKKPSNDDHFLQIVAEPKRPARPKSTAKAEPKLTRVAFKVSRLMELGAARGAVPL
jgi:hypothetical protein